MSPCRRRATRVLVALTATTAVAFPLPAQPWRPSPIGPVWISTATALATASAIAPSSALRGTRPVTAGVRARTSGASCRWYTRLAGPVVGAAAGGALGHAVGRMTGAVAVIGEDNDDVAARRRAQHRRGALAAGAGLGAIAGWASVRAMCRERPVAA